MKILRNGSINNIPISYQDIINRREIFGPDEFCIKGKTTNSPPKLPHPERVSKQQEKIQTLIIDIMYVSGEAFIISVSKPLDLIVADHLSSYGSKERKNTPIIKTSLFGVLSQYRAEGFHIYSIVCDEEPAFVSLQPDINALGSSISYNISSSHSTAIIDRKIRFIKERARSVISSLSFNLPKILLKWLVYYVVSRINLTPHGDSAISPRELFIGRRTEYNLDLRIAFGAYAQVLTSTTDNTMKERTTDCIAMYPTGNKNGSVVFFSINTGKFITRDQ
jgi:hypothetical protein